MDINVQEDQTKKIYGTPVFIEHGKINNETLAASSGQSDGSNYS